jgi:hypothetical protein
MKNKFSLSFALLCVCALAVLIPVLPATAYDVLFWSKPADDTTRSWDTAGAWKQVNAPNAFVNRVPNDEDTLMLNSSAIALAGNGITESCSLRITNGVEAVANRVYIASTAANEDSSYAKSGRVIGMKIEKGGSLSAYEVSVGYSAAGYGVLNLDGGVLKPSHDLFIGYEGIGVLTNRNGTIQNTGGCQGINIAEQEGSKGTYVMLGKNASVGNSENMNLFVGKYGEGRAEIYSNITIPYLKIGGSTALSSCYVAHSTTTTVVTKAVSVGGYAFVELNKDGSVKETYRIPGRGELVLSNAVLSACMALSTTNFWIGRYDGAFGVLRGCGAVQGKNWNDNSLRIGFGNGQVIGDGFGKQADLDMNTVVAFQVANANPDEGTNGIYAVNKGAVKFPRVWFSTVDASGSIGDVPKGSPSLVNCVGYSIRGLQGANSVSVLRGGLYAADRTDVHVDALPPCGSIVGIWRLGLFTDITGFTPKGYQNIDLTFRYDHTKVKQDQKLALYRWNGSKWKRMASKPAATNPRIVCEGITPQTVEGYNIGLFALVTRRDGMKIIVR